MIPHQVEIESLSVSCGGPALVSQLDAPVQRRQELAAFFARALGSLTAVNKTTSCGFV